jgi:ATP-dependent helicase/nuclease subunit A
LALELDSGRYPSLPRFIDELEELTVAKDAESPDEGITDFGDTVRIMTIHGAKGLEAPVVVLSDAGSAASHADDHDVLISWPPDASRPSHLSVYASKDSRGAARAPLFDEEDRLDGEEDWNLLYVALTRARNVLVVSGVASDRNHAHTSWYERCEVALPLVESPRHEPRPFAPEERVRAFEVREFRPKRLPVGARLAATQGASSRDEAARQRGIALHRVLELQPGAAFTVERAIAIAMTEGLDAQAAEQVARMALAIRLAPHLQRFFDPVQFRRAHNEVEFVDRGGRLFRVDRLVEFDDEVWVLDYKSQGSARGIEPHRQQLEGYTALVGAVFADRVVKGAVIFADASLATL